MYLTMFYNHFDPKHRIIENKRVHNQYRSLNYTSATRCPWSYFQQLDQTRITRNSTNQTLTLRLYEFPHSRIMTEISIGLRECNMYQILGPKEAKIDTRPAPFS